MVSVDFKLRKWKTSDAEDVAYFANNEKIACKLRNAFPYPYTLDDAKFYVTDCSGNDETRQICRAIIVDGRAVGSVGIFLKDDVYSKSGELGYWLGEEYWNKGIMTSAVKQLCTEAFEKYDIVRIYSEPFAINNGSRRVLEKAGFTLEGLMKKSVYKNNELLDSCMYSLLK